MPGIEEDIIPISESEDKMHMHIIPDEGKRVRRNEIFEKSSDLTYLNKDADADTLAYDGLLNALKKLDKAYNPKIHKMHKPVIEGNYKVTGYTKFIPIVEHKDGKIQWVYSTSISAYAGDPETLKEAMTRPNGNLWKMSEISEVKSFLSRKAWILKKRSAIKSKGRNPVPFKWVFKSK